jgi:hypothetical protein
MAKLERQKRSADAARERTRPNELLRRAWFCALRAAAFAAIGAAAWYSMEIRSAVLRDPGLRLSGWSLEFGEFPSWVSPEIRHEIEAINRSAILGPRAGGESILKKRLLAEVRSELLANSWVRAVRSIRLIYPGIDGSGRRRSGGLSAELELRQPVAVVEWAGRYHYTDADCRVLGEPLPSRQALAMAIPVVTGTASVAFAPAPRPGELWQAREVLEGLAVARALHRSGLGGRYPERPVEEIDVANVGGKLRRLDSEVVLRVRGVSPPLAWGRSPIAVGNQVLSVPETLANLEKVLQADPRDLDGVTLIRLYTATLVGETASASAR